MTTVLCPSRSYLSMDWTQLGRMGTQDHYALLPPEIFNLRVNITLIKWKTIFSNIWIYTLGLTAYIGKTARFWGAWPVPVYFCYSAVASMTSTKTKGPEGGQREYFHSIIIIQKLTKLGSVVVNIRPQASCRPQLWKPSLQNCQPCPTSETHGKVHAVHWKHLFIQIYMLFKKLTIGFNLVAPVVCSVLYCTHQGVVPAVHPLVK